MNRKLVEALAKVMAAAGWADKDLAPDEIENLKDLLFQFQRSAMDPREDAVFEMYTMSPIHAAERDRLVGQLRETVWSEQDRSLALSALRQMVEADGKITEEEEALLNSIRAEIESVDTTIFGDLGRLIRLALRHRSRTHPQAPNREKYFREFLNNKFYYEIRRRLDEHGWDLELPEEDVRKLSIISGLMARVAHTDNLTLENEIGKIIDLLQAGWGLSQEAAVFVTGCALSDVSQDFDYLRTAREFIELTTPAERIKLVDLLFAVAMADGSVSNDELLEIAFIADYLLISLDRVNRALWKVSR